MGRTLTVDLGEELRGFVEGLVASGDYRTPSEVIRESVRTLRERTAASKLEELRRLIAEGEIVAMPKSGIEMCSWKEYGVKQKDAEKNSRPPKSAG